MQLQDALNTVWGLQLKPGTGLRGMVRDRLQSFSMVLGAGFLLLISLVLTTALQGASTLLAGIAPLHPLFWTLLSSVVSFLVVTLLFAAIFRILPDADIAWSDVWLGAVATSVLFGIGKFGLSWYLGREATASSYGSAGAFILILLWVHYSSLILLFGAEFTQVQAALRGRHITPSDRAVRVEASAPVTTPREQ